MMGFNSKDNSSNFIERITKLYRPQVQQKPYSQLNLGFKKTDLVKRKKIAISQTQGLIF